MAATSAALKKHALVVLVAVLVATYQLYRLEAQRARRGVDADEEFERATRFLQSQLAAQRGRYEVRVTLPAHAGTAASPSAAAAKTLRTALVISRHHAVPRIEAELFVDAQLAAERRAHKSGSKKPRSSGGYGAAHSGPKATLRMRVYDAAAMDAIAKALQHKKLIESYEIQ